MPSGASIKEVFRFAPEYLGVGPEQWLQVEELGHDASDAPQVNGGGVALETEEELGRSVVQRYHLMRE